MSVLNSTSLYGSEGGTAAHFHAANVQTDVARKMTSPNRKTTRDKIRGGMRQEFAGTGAFSSVDSTQPDGAGMLHSE